MPDFLGVIIRGQTPHFEYIRTEVSPPPRQKKQIGEAGIINGPCPSLFGVIKQVRECPKSVKSIVARRGVISATGVRCPRKTPVI